MLKKTKLMANKSDSIKRDINVSGQRHEAVNSFKYLGAIMTDKTPKPEVLSTIVQASAVLAGFRIV